MKKEKVLERLYLHIGLEKTGTSTIQEFLEANRHALSVDRIFLPKDLGNKNHKRIAAYAFDAGARDISVVSCNVGETEANVEAFRAQVTERLTAEVKASDARTGVISSEDLSRLFNPVQVERVIDLLRPLCQDLKVVIFARRQDLLASSRYYSLLLGGSQNNRVFPQPKDEPPRFYDYARNIGLWIDAVGKENVLLVRYPENAKKEGFDSTELFLQVLGVDISRYTRVKSQHISLDVVNQIIIQNFNVMRSKFDAKAMEALISDLTCHNDRRYRHMTSEQQARIFYEQFRADNFALFEKLGILDQMFSDDFSMYPSTNQRMRLQQIAIQRLLALPAPKPETTNASLVKYQKTV